LFGLRPHQLFGLGSVEWLGGLLSFVRFGGHQRFQASSLEFEYCEAVVFCFCPDESFKNLVVRTLCEKGWVQITPDFIEGLEIECAAVSGFHRFNGSKFKLAE
jgi:hypothetical protein